MTSRRHARLLGPALAVLATFGPVAWAHAAQGSDGGFGYTWRDSADGATRDPFTQDSPSLLTINPDNAAPAYVPWPPGFNPPFYGVATTGCYVSDNGWISFEAQGNAFPTPPLFIPNMAQPPNAFIAPMWRDLRFDDPGSGNYIVHGHNAALNAYKFTCAGIESPPGDRVNYEVCVYADGRIKFQYGARPYPNIASFAVGIESHAAVNDGIQIIANGVARPGVAITLDYVLEFRPPGVMNGQCSSIPTRACGTINGSLPGSLPGNVIFYGCSGNRYDALEQVYRIDIATPQILNFTLTGDIDQRAFLLGACNEYFCLRGPTRTLTVPLSPGSYWIAVDAPTVGDQGPFGLNLSCSPLGTPVACGATVSGSSPLSASLFDSYSCTGAAAYGGSENIYDLTVPAGTTIQARLLSGPATLDVFLLRLDLTGGIITGASCIAWGDQQAVIWGGPDTRYLVVVDSPAGGGGAFQLVVSCPPDISCGSPTGIIDFAGSPVQSISGDTSLATNQSNIYRCDPDGNYAGGEHIYRMTIPVDGQVTVYPVTGDQSYFLLSPCSIASCIGSEGCSTPLTAGTYYLVVDGPTAGAYSAQVFLEVPPFPRWTECEGFNPPTTAEDTASQIWFLSDGWYCIGDPQSRNYDRNGDGIGPDGCLFAMYASVRCGTEMHLPFYDVEGGHVRIFDIMRGQYVNLTARSTGGFFQTGIDIQWEDCAGGNPLWNEQTTDVFFTRPEGLCGIFRIEFPNHSGHVWELYSNCTGERVPGFYIYDSLCNALADYVPLPNVTLIDADADYNCPNVTITYTIRNDGCAPVSNFPLVLFDGVDPAHTEVVPYIGSGEELTLTFTASVSVPSNPLMLACDPTDFSNPNGLVLECIEVPGAGCNPLEGTEFINLPPCSGECSIVANAVANPPSLCIGQTTTIDASGTFVALCGGSLEYQLRGPGITPAWQPLPAFPGIAPTTTSSYDVDVRCSADHACMDSVRVTVPVERPPDLPPPSVEARDVQPCNPYIEVSWDPATFYGPGGSGTYAVYVSTVSCADAIAGGPSIIGLTTTSITFATTGGETYYFVVEAEDDTIGTRCIPPGPRNGGAVTRVEANFGTCTGILDVASVQTDLLPRIGATLRAGGDYGDGTTRYGQTFVEFQWQVTDPLDLATDEHFHFYRSEQPDDVSTQLTSDSPFLQTNGFLDLLADDTQGSGNNVDVHCWYYLAFVADSCDNENTAYDDLP